MYSLQLLLELIMKIDFSIPNNSFEEDLLFF